MTEEINSSGIGSVDQLISEINSKWGAPEGLLKSKSMAKVIREAFYMSLTASEGRYPRILLASVDTEHLPYPPVRLGEPIRNLDGVIPIAPAIAPPPFALLLRENLSCAGIIDLKSARNSPGSFFAIRGPGALEVQTYHRTQRSSWILHSGREFQMLRHLNKSKIFETICEIAAQRNRHSRVKNDCRKILSTLAYAVSRRGEGGALVFTDLSRGKIEGATRAEIDFGRRPFDLLEPSTSEVETARIISCLTQIDGAVLLDAEFRIMGAGVFLNQDGANVREYRKDGMGPPCEDFRTLGSRHRSAAWFCQTNIGSRALVISKDQFFRLFSHRESGVVCEGPFTDSIIDIAREGNSL